jgi:hypothetical protein
MTLFMVTMALAQFGMLVSSVACISSSGVLASNQEAVWEKRALEWYDADEGL